jgi:hypothetical protein
LKLPVPDKGKKINSNETEGDNSMAMVIGPTTADVAVDKINLLAPKGDIKSAPSPIFKPSLGLRASFSDSFQQHNKFTLPLLGVGRKR